jgi:hypothetical protein
MNVFIDESGRFIPGDRLSVICALTIPHGSTGRARRELKFASGDWKKTDGELKGAHLDQSQLEVLVDLLFRHDALLHYSAIDVSREKVADVKFHKSRQAEGTTTRLTAEHHPDLVKEVWKLREIVEAMPDQLYVQCVLQTDLICRVVEEVCIYFSQRRPKELGQFEWWIDAKDKKITTQEKWWRDVVGPTIESRSLRQPFITVRDAGFNYRHFDRSFSFRKRMWFSDRPRKKLEGIDIKKLIVDATEFIDSKSDILIQAADVLCSTARRAIQAADYDERLLRTLGRLQLYRRRGGILQSPSLISLSRGGTPNNPRLARRLGVMTEEGRLFFTAQNRSSRHR